MCISESKFPIYFLEVILPENHKISDFFPTHSLSIFLSFLLDKVGMKYNIAVGLFLKWNQCIFSWWNFILDMGVVVFECSLELNLKYIQGAFTESRSMHKNMLFSAKSAQSRQKWLVPTWWIQWPSIYDFKQKLFWIPDTCSLTLWRLVEFFFIFI